MTGAPGRGWLLVIVGMLVLVPAAQQASAHHYEESPIQPGAEIGYPGLCSFNFVYADQVGALYIGTAGHCVDHEGQPVIPADYDQAIGEVVWRAYGDGLDFALIEIEPELYDEVDPTVRHWGGPTGVAAQEDREVGDPVLHYGNGVYYRESELLRPRVGVLVDPGATHYCADTGVYGGDSGSPVLTGDGLALGIVVRLGLGCEPPTSLHGPTLPYILDRAEQQAGLDLDVVTGPLTEPVEREQQRLAHLP